jgi:hypothetical protein
MEEKTNDKSKCIFERTNGARTQREIKFYAESHGLSMSAMVRQVMIDWVGQKDWERSQPIVSRTR